MNRTLSIAEWCELAQEGTRLPVRIPLMGHSMFPLVRYNRDLVTVVPLDKPVQIGDIVLFADHGRNLYVMHRVWALKDKTVQTWGDNCDGPDGWFPMEAVWGRVILIERGSREIHPDPQKGIRWAKFWHQGRKAYHLYRKCKDGINRQIKKIRT